eukprot:6889926-Pyramimonas_sp.AAC.1
MNLLYTDGGGTWGAWWGRIRVVADPSATTLASQQRPWAQTFCVWSGQRETSDLEVEAAAN